MEQQKRCKVTTPVNDRMKLIESVFIHGSKPKDAARLLKINEYTAYGILRTFQRENRVDVKEKKGRKRMFNDQYEKQIVDYFLQQPDATLAECQGYIEKNPRKFGPIIASKTTIDRILRKSKVTTKSLSVIPQARNSKPTIEKRYYYAHKFNYFENHPKQFIYIDEMGRNLHVRRRKGRSPIGKPACIQVPTQRGGNLSICAAISKSGYIHYRAKLLAYNHQEYLIFLNELKEKLDMNCQYVFVMDNARFHHSRPIVDWFDQFENIDLLYLPPYSPFLNPIEECFSKIHNSLALSRPDKPTDLLSAVKRAFDEIRPEDCDGWFRHSRKYIPMCFDKRPILKEADEYCPRFVVEEGEEDEADNGEIDELVDLENF